MSMGTRVATLEDIRRAGIEALTRELGPVGMVRFLQQFETGRGDCTTERQQWLGDQDVRTLAGRIQRRNEETTKKD